MSDIQARISAGVAGQFRIEREVGSGGMATVYLARDTKHDRDVALKVLRPELVQSLGVERFLQEIRLIARLSHPNILPLLDSGNADGLPYYVMPYVAGESLRDRLGRERQLPVDEAIQIAREIADALGAAHAEGVVHRDIKPENVLLAGGKAVVSDFGIARAVRAAGGSRLTESGLAIGTPAYMSPEQASGDDRLDMRTDLYSLGCVLYEMLAGEPPFTGPSAQAITARKLTETAPGISAVRDTVGPAVDETVRRALARLPADRFRTAAEFSSALARAGSHVPATPGLLDRLGARRRMSVPRWSVWAAGGVLTAALAYGTWAPRSVGVPPGSPRAVLSIPLAAGNRAGGINANLVAISPNARYIVWTTTLSLSTGGPNLRLRRMDQPDITPIGDPGRHPFFSPDAQWLGFFTGDQLAKTPIDGGPVLPIVPAPGHVRGATWGEELIVYAAGDERGLMFVPATGGVPTRLTEPDTADGVIDHRWPEMLPDDRGVLFTIWTGDIESARVAVARLPSGETTILARSGFSPRYVPSTGEVAWAVSSGSILTAAFDLRRLELSGPALPSLEGVSVQPSGAAAYSVARDGTVLFLAHGEGWEGAVLSVDRETGLTTRLFDETAFITEPRVSPDGGRVAFAVGGGARYDIRTYDLESGIRRTLTDRGWNRRPAWSPDGSRILFVSRPLPEFPDSTRLLETHADGRGSPAVLIESAGPNEALWTPDGATVVLSAAPTDSRDIGIFRPGSQASPDYIISTPGADLRPRLSRDGRWLAYMSDETGQREVYVAAFPEGRPGRLISRNGGTEPAWCPSGDELFYRSAAGEMMAVAFESDSTFRIRSQTRLFDASAFEVDVFPACDRFIAIERSPAPAQELVVALGWYRRTTVDRR